MTSGDAVSRDGERPAEAVVAGIWREVLGVERVGSTDDFFDLGGDSLSATRVSVRLCEIFREDLPLEDVLGRPTIEGVVDSLIARCGGRDAVDATARAWQEIMRLSDAEVRAELVTLAPAR
jgi:acyl carrier protein